MVKKDDYKFTPTYKKQIRDMILKSSVDKVPTSEATFEYLITKHDGEMLRFRDVESDLVYFCDLKKFDTKLKYYNMTFETFFTEIEVIGFTMFY